MLKFLSKVRIEFNALDPRTAACMEFLAQCNARKAKESNPSCQLLVKRRTDDHPPQITVTFVNGVEEVFDATSTSAQSIRTMILEKGQMLETEQMFRDAGEKWPVVVPEEEIHQHAPGTKEITLGPRNVQPPDVDLRSSGLRKAKILLITEEKRHLMNYSSCPCITQKAAASEYRSVRGLQPHCAVLFWFSAVQIMVSIIE
ncbi:hypothetical protein RHSIM_Rhsim07G0245900 [Rhododendron simsii]|uniref:Large ribosomal subunit protein mL53 n=1 Tax=Rhododendron simsii TaxID=118357 RepID=A0A834LIV7_RHOSS|nr:hypothetical protein RHSIM_Rhsim07G0245900 [Rhododendron simsii]